ncbi:hypothetical protein Isop_3419 [Isosphaera pallida ATCC 43644]|uniref:Uncharacterized protein n=1 Tax=Isosphaera pallida (strain ATCC 43644 / DSM 9630 / IS1B) TaxID=575540 RepID=E8R6S5_ISOPI|nr:hypothetical protein Isop_3419 [Isosphaera pallida ATCC 43644]
MLQFTAANEVSHDQTNGSTQLLIQPRRNGPDWASVAIDPDPCKPPSRRMVAESARIGQWRTLFAVLSAPE